MKWFSMHKLLQYIIVVSFVNGSNFAQDWYRRKNVAVQDRRFSSRKLLSRTRGISCPAPNGIFPYAEDCSKFINCANNFGHLQNCGPGTLFNPKYNVCDWPQNTICYVDPHTAKTATTESTTYRYIYFPTKSFLEFDSLFPGSNKQPESHSKTNREENTTVKIKSSGSRTKRARPSNTPSLCLKPTGQFPYPKDCSKFVNCWNNRETLQSCSPGTSFDASSARCSWTHEAICGAEDVITNSIPETKLIKKSIPNSGQFLRLRGSNSPYCGYLQVYINGEWLYVIHKGEESGNSDEMCNNMGFKRGTRSSSRGLVHGRTNVVKHEKSIVKCKELDDASQCSVIKFNPLKHMEHIVGLRCKEDSASKCPVDWFSWRNSCFRVNAYERLGRGEASEVCKSFGGQLLTIEDQEKNNYISDLLMATGIYGGVHTSGIIQVAKEMRFRWTGNTTVSNSNFRNWWSDTSTDSFETSYYSRQQYEGKISCITLRNIYQIEGQQLDVEYFFWNIESCDSRLNFVCERQPYDIGCIDGNGATYNGPANISRTGLPCKHWNETSTMRLSSMELELPKDNYCANPDGDQRPWCYTKSGLAEECDIPRCPARESENTKSITACKRHQKMCNDGKCIPFDQICDGIQNCVDGEDEGSCPDYGSFFKSIPDHAMDIHTAETWLFTGLDVCQRKCAKAKSFNCLAISHDNDKMICVLHNFIALKTGGLLRRKGWIYYFRQELDVNCTNKFRCSDFKCIQKEQVCDGKADCIEAEDESECRFEESFALRLVNGDGPHEGNVEVKVFLPGGMEWGPVCGDVWDLQDGNVVCQQLGFAKGAKEVHSNSRFGISTRQYLMDDVSCQGSEKSLVHCLFSGWLKHDCVEGQAAGVTCYQDEEVCPEDEFACDNGHCIKYGYYCDTFDDCGDNSDERKSQCKSSPLEIRLVNDKEDLRKSGRGEDIDNVWMEGRVEIFYKGVWGTICDDDIELNEGHVLCRMLGWDKAESVHKNSSFGAGQGPVWFEDLKCYGTENTIMDCRHSAYLGSSSKCDHTEDLGVRCAKDLKPDSFGEDLLEAVYPGQCGATYVDPGDIRDPDIPHGIMLSPGARPWMASIRKKTRIRSIHGCGAFIITNTTLLTAAHCLESRSRKGYIIRTGDFHRTERDRFEAEWEIAARIFHPNYRPGNYDNDIALVRIKPINGRVISFNEYVQPICLPPKNWKYEAGINCTVSGWGKAGGNGYDGYSLKLLSAMVPIIADSKCKDDLVYGPHSISDSMFCAGYLEGGTDSCKGDSGGPLICPVKGVNTAVGIVSWGDGCGDANKPGVYTKMTKFIEWIKAMVLQEISPAESVF